MRLFQSFRNRLLILFSALAFILGLGSIIYVGHISSVQMTQASGEALHLSAKNIANMFATTLNEREREIRLLAQSPFFMESALDDPLLQLKLDQVQSSYQYYAWLGVTNPEGRVMLAAQQLLEGADVSMRPWFQEGLKGAYLGDVHDAVLLAKKIKARNPDEPLRLIDFSMPIYDAQQNLKGVLGAHADWSWASHALKIALPEHAEKQGIEVFIVNAKGEVIYPYKSVGQIQPPAFGQHDQVYFKDHWGEDQHYLSSDYPIFSEAEMNLGWHVMLRQPVALALTELKQLQQQILLMGALVFILLLILAYRLANRLSQPIEQLARAARQLERGKDDVSFEQSSNIREIKTLSQTLTSMTHALLSQKAALLDSNNSLEQKVKQRTHDLERANIELEKLARHDALTELKNRRALDEHLDYMFVQFQRYRFDYAILLLDIDWFKKVNDDFGHEVGDHVLKVVSRVLTMNVRESDFLARFGGEEFIVILPMTDAESAMQMAEKIRHAVEHEQILEQRKITTSIGIGFVHVDDTQAQDAIRRADSCLYAAKADGRNCVISECACS